jgi:hypothetical protein
LEHRIAHEKRESKFIVILENVLLEKSETAVENLSSKTLLASTLCEPSYYSNRDQNHEQAKHTPSKWFVAIRQCSDSKKQGGHYARQRKHGIDDGVPPNVIIESPQASMNATLDQPVMDRKAHFSRPGCE